MQKKEIHLAAIELDWHMAALEYCPLLCRFFWAKCLGQWKKKLPLGGNALGVARGCCVYVCVFVFVYVCVLCLCCVSICVLYEYECESCVCVV